MSIPNRQIGWSVEANLMNQISLQLDRLTKLRTGVIPTTTTTSTIAQQWYQITECYTTNVLNSVNYLPGTFALNDRVTYYLGGDWTVTNILSTDPGGTQFELSNTFATGCPPAPDVTIGTQIWTSRNLDVDTYRNGDPIPQVTDPTAWAALTTGAWCYYFNDNSYFGPTYGKLYNAYAVNDPRGLAPTGYHIPTDAEWTVLTDYLGGLTVAGGAIKDIGTAHWSSPNTGATNSSGFTGFGGGIRNFVGVFALNQSQGYWWSSTENDPTSSFCRNIEYNSTYAYDGFTYKANGLSIRLIKD